MTKAYRLKAEDVGFSATNANIAGTSASRTTMALKMAEQVPVIKHSDRNPQITGAEMELNRTFDVRMPEDGTIVEIFSRYPHTAAQGWNKVLVVYENDRGVLDAFELPSYFFHHTTFGFPYVAQPAKSRIRRGMSFRKGEVFLDTPNRHDDGWYGNGVLLNVVAISHPATGDDGIGVCEDVLDKFTMYLMNTTTVKVGSENIMLNLYDGNKVMPDLGEYVNEDGLLVATREYREDRAFTSMSRNALRRVDPNSDALFLVPKNSKVVDITVINNPNQNTWSMGGVHDQVAEYWRYTRAYYEQLVDFFRQHIGGNKTTDRPRKQMGDTLARAIREAMIHLQPPSISRLNRAGPLPEWMVTITTMSEFVPHRGSKIVSGAQSADKGVISAILKPEEMPRDRTGRRADAVFGTESAFGRMTMGPVRELAYNSATESIIKHIKAKYGISPTGTIEQYKREAWRAGEALDQEMQKFYSMVGEEAIEDYLSATMEERIEEMAEVFYTELPDLTLPIDRAGSDIDRDQRFLGETYPGTLCYGPVTFTYKGKEITTEHPALIGKRYLTALEQIGSDASASASSAHNVTGLTSHTSPTTDFGYSTGTTANRIGNVEARVIELQSITTYGDRDRKMVDPTGTMLAELIARNGSHKDHRLCISAILNAPEPGRIENLIDREVHPYGSPRSVTIYQQLLLAQGARYVPEGRDDVYEF